MAEARSISGRALAVRPRGFAGAAVVYSTRFLRLVKFEHSLFALPFAFAAAFLAQMHIPGFWRMFWITVAMVAARNLGMALNRLVDAKIDAQNPRTAGRELPSGLLRRWQVWAFNFVSLTILIVATFHLPVITRYLWPVVVIPMLIYPWTKRWTWLSHVILGVTDGLGPVGAWVAATGKVTWEPFALGAAVALWIAGFDVIYAFMDVEIDRAQGLHSIPADLGYEAGLLSTRLFHTLSVVLLAWVGYIQSAGPLYYAGVAVCAALLFYENWLMRKADLANVGVAFMTMNGVISVAFLAFTTVAVIVQ